VSMADIYYSQQIDFSGHRDCARIRQKYPQRLKPFLYRGIFGTTKVMP